MPKAQVHTTPCEEEVFYSMFGMDHSIYAHVQAARPVTEFDGAYYADFLYLSIDRDGDVGTALSSARKLVGKLYDCFSVSPRLLTLYYSGNKSFYIGLHQALFGSFAPAHVLPGQLKTLSGLLVATCYGLSLDTVQHLEGGTLAAGGHYFADVDTSIYRPGQLLRAPNSRHGISGRYKVPLYASELMSASLQQLQALARRPRTDFSPPPHLASEPAITPLADLWKEAQGYEVAGQTTLAPPPDADFFAPPAAASRSSTLYHQACRLFDSSTLAPAHVARLVEALNASGTAPLPVADVRQLVMAAAYKAGESGGLLPAGGGHVRPGSVVPASGLPWVDQSHPATRIFCGRS